MTRTAALAVLLAPAVSLAATGPSLVMVHSGRLLDAADAPVSGPRDLTFSLLPFLQHQVGEQVAWTETYTVSVDRGMYTVELGSEEGGKAKLPASTFAVDTPLFLEISLGGVAFTPRMRVGMVPVAAVALTARGLECQGCVKKEALGFKVDELADGTVKAPAIADGAVKASAIADGAVTTRAVNAGAITDDLLATGIDGEKLAPGTVMNEALANGIDGAKLKSSSVANAALATGIDGMKLLSGSITNDALASGIDGAKLSNASVANGALANGIDGAKLATGSVGSAALGNGIDGAKLAAGSVGNGALATGIDGAKLTNGSIGNAALASGIDGAKLSNGSIGNAALATGIDGAKLTAGSVANAALGNGIDGAKLTAGSVPMSALAGLPIANQTCPAGSAMTGFTAQSLPICAPAQFHPVLRDRLASLPIMGTDARQGYGTFLSVPGVYLPFFATGGPVEIGLSFPLNGGSTATCRSLIDGVPAGVYSGADLSYIWQEGLTYTGGQWRMWNTHRLYPNVPVGPHMLGLQCQNDSSTTSYLGNQSMMQLASVIPYDPPATAEAKAYTASIRGGQTVTQGSFQAISGLAVSFTAQGGPVRMSWSVPLNNSSGGHGSCRTLVDGAPAGTGEIDDTGYAWQEGLVYAGPNWNMFNRTRIYTNIASGNHTATLQCYSDTGSMAVGNGSMTIHLAVVTYKPASDSTATIKAYRGTERIQYSIPIGSNWVTLAGTSAGGGINQIPFTTNGGPVEIGVSVPIVNGSHAGCRVLIDNSTVNSEPDNFGYIWQEGLAYTSPGWHTWDRSRIYRGIPAGNHTMGVQCRTDGGTMNAGHPNMVSTIWAVAYNK